MTSSNDQLIPYPDYMKLSDDWAEFFYDKTTEEILLPILASLGGRKFYPEKEDIFRCFYLTPLAKVKAVILGQDPYHNGSATGLCFEVKLGCQINPSLHNIYKQLEAEKFYPTQDGLLTQWAQQGVLLLNTALTVAPTVAESHLDLWRPFFEHLISFLARQNKIVWILLGRKAIDWKPLLLTNDTHQSVESTHPSPLSAYKGSATLRAFFGSNVFTETNKLLKAMGHSEIVW